MSPHSEDFRLPEDHPMRRLQLPALAVGGGGLVLSGIGWMIDPQQFFRSYLIAFLFWSGIALGSLAVLMLQHVTGGTWGAVIRRVLEAATRTLQVVLLLYVPIVLGFSYLYEWAHADVVANDEILLHKSFYLNVPFFFVRLAIYFGVWLVLAYFLNRWSLEQDTEPGPGVERRLEYLSRGGLLLYSLTMTFASIDWAMSLEPHWFSTIYGMLFIGGQVLAAFAFVIPVMASLATGPVAKYVGADQFHDLGKLLLAFIMVWAYFAFSQFLIIWSGNLPEETPWYISRLAGGWQAMGGAIILFHFALPFAILLSRDLKRDARRLQVVAVALLFVRFVDVYWMVEPAFSPGRLAVHWLDVTTLIGVGGIWLAAFFRQVGTRPLLPVGDPLLEEETGVAPHRVTA
jgi:hypothetical protein